MNAESATAVQIALSLRKMKNDTLISSHSDDYIVRYIHYDNDEAFFCHGIDSSFDEVVESYGFRVLKAQSCDGGWNILVSASKHCLFRNIINRVSYLTILPDDFSFNTDGSQ